MISSTKIKACALVLLIVIVLIQIEFIESKSGRIRISRRRWWSRHRGHGVPHRSWSRSTGSTGTFPSLLLIAGLFAIGFVDFGMNYGPPDELGRLNGVQNHSKN